MTDLALGGETSYGEHVGEAADVAPAVEDADGLQHARHAQPGHVAAPYAGAVTVSVAEGDTVQAGDTVATIEAMKMEAGITTTVGTPDAAWWQARLLTASPRPPLRANGAYPGAVMRRRRGGFLLAASERPARRGA